MAGRNRGAPVVCSSDHSADTTPQPRGRCRLFPPAPRGPTGRVVRAGRARLLFSRRRTPAGSARTVRPVGRRYSAVRVFATRPARGSAARAVRLPSATKSMSSLSRPLIRWVRDNAVSPMKCRRSPNRSLITARRWEIKWSRSTCSGETPNRCPRRSHLEHVTYRSARLRYTASVSIRRGSARIHTTTLHDPPPRCTVWSTRGLSSHSPQLSAAGKRSRAARLRLRRQRPWRGDYTLADPAH